MKALKRMKGGQKTKTKKSGGGLQT
jgi:hypothetical protein